MVDTHNKGRNSSNDKWPTIKRYTSIMVQELLHTVARNLNQLPPTDGVLDKLSPLLIVTGKREAN